MTWNTPQILKAGGAAGSLAALILMLAVITGARAHRHEIQVIGRDSAPSIIAAQRMGTALADMDAAANENDQRRFEARRIEAVSSLISAAENITYGDAERVPIRKLAVGIGTYTAMVQNARDNRNIELWRQAAAFMDSELLPAAEALEKANRDALEETWSQQQAASQRVLAITAVAAFLLGGVLVGLQVFLAQRVRRTLNAGLLGATVAAWIFVVFAAQAFRRADTDLKIAKEDAFDSIISLWQARSLALAANADISRSLLDTAKSPLHQKAFADKDRRIRDDLRKELNNVTFAGEGDAAKESQSRYLEWVKQKTAANLSLLDAALSKTVQLNQDQFAASVDRGFADVANFEVIAPVGALAICGLIWFGLWPRISEYSV